MQTSRAVIAAAGFENTSQWAGAFSFMLLMLALALWFGRKGLTAGTRSLKYANLSLCMGLLVWVQPRMLFDLRPPLLTWVLVASGLVRMGVALAGVIFAGVAFARRGADGGTGWARPGLGMGFSLLHGLNGLAFCVMPLLMGAAGGPHRVALERHGISLELPSDDWKQVPVKDAAARFVRRFPPAGITVMVTPGTLEDHEQTVEEFRQWLKTPGAKILGEPEHSTIPAEGGRAISICRVESKAVTGEGIIPTATAYIWLPERSVTVLIICEMRPVATSETFGNIEKSSFRELIESVATSVRGLTAAPA